MVTKNQVEQLAGAEKKQQYQQNDGRVFQLIFVEDEEEDIYLFKRGLEELKINHEIHHARSGDEMFDMLENVKPDYIILDIFMPGKSGIACLKMLRIQQLCDDVPIIIYSKFIQPSFIDDCYKAKANYFVVKANTVNDLTHAIHTIFSTNWQQEMFPKREHFLITPKSQ